MQRSANGCEQFLSNNMMMMRGEHMEGSENNNIMGDGVGSGDEHDLMGSGDMGGGGNGGAGASGQSKKLRYHRHTAFQIQQMEK
mgnify:CR=1 FL=1